MIHITEDSPSLSHFAMSESAAVDRDILNLMYNYGKTELQKDITAFGKHHLLKENETSDSDLLMRLDNSDNESTKVSTVDDDPSKKVKYGLKALKIGLGISSLGAAKYAYDKNRKPSAKKKG